MTCSKEGKISEAPEKQKNVAFPVRKKEKLIKKKIKIMVIDQDSLCIIKKDYFFSLRTSGFQLYIQNCLN